MCPASSLRLVWRDKSKCPSWLVKLCSQTMCSVSQSQSQFSCWSHFSGLRSDETNTKRHPNTSIYSPRFARERRYLFLCYLLNQFGFVDFSRNLAHVRRLNFTRAFIHGICSVFIPLKGTNRFHLEIIQPLLALPMDVSASRPHNGKGC